MPRVSGWRSSTAGAGPPCRTLRGFNWTGALSPHPRAGSFRAPPSLTAPSAPSLGWMSPTPGTSAPGFCRSGMPGSQLPPLSSPARCSTWNRFHDSSCPQLQPGLILYIKTGRLPRRGSWYQGVVRYPWRVTALRAWKHCFALSSVCTCMPAQSLSHLWLFATHGL